MSVLDYRGKPRVQTVNDEPSLTVQADTLQTDIQEILRPYSPAGLAVMLDDAELVYADVSDYSDYADMMRNAKLAEAEFMKLPSKVREVFEHDVMNWLDAANDPEKRSRYLEKVGLVDPAAGGDPARGSSVETPPASPAPVVDGGVAE